MKRIQFAIIAILVLASCQVWGFGFESGGTPIATSSRPGKVKPDGTSISIATDGTIAAANVSGTPALPNGTTATTQSAGDKSTKLATTAYVDNAYVSHIICQSATPVSVNGSLALTTLATCTIPANTMLANGAVRITEQWTTTSSANTKTTSLKFGGTGGTQYSAAALTTSVGYFDQRTIRNRNATNSQVGPPSLVSTYGTTASAAITSSVDTTQAVDIVIAGLTTLETGYATTGVVGSGGVCTATKSTHGLNTGEYVKASGGGDCPTSGNPNADPVQVTVSDANTFTYACTCVGTEAGTQPTVQRYSVVRLEGYTVELLPRP